MKVTIYDVAKASGVSPSTVSKVMNRTGRISDATRKRVLEAMEELSFQPSVVASALKAKKTFTVGLLVSDITNPFCSTLAKAVEDVAIIRGYNVLLASTSNESQRHRKLIDMLLQKQVDGYILSSFIEDDDDFAKTLARDRPVVLADRMIPGAPVSAVTSDNVYGGYVATNYLLEKGHRDIGLFLEDPRISSSSERMLGYVMALREQGIEPRPEWIISGQFGLDGGKNMLLRVYELPQKPTAIFAANDLLAIGALQQSFKLNWRIPEELSIVGYDDIPVAAMINPPLTTVRQPVLEMGKVAFDLLMKIIEGNNSETHQGVFLLQPDLIERSSVATHSPSVIH